LLAEPTSVRRDTTEAKTAFVFCETVEKHYFADCSKTTSPALLCALYLTSFQRPKGIGLPAALASQCL
jgi:hypothetical protein